MVPLSGHHDMKPTLNYLVEPDLKTSTENYDFKYVQASDLNEVVDNVRRDRLKWQQDDLWTNFCQIEQDRHSGASKISVEKSTTTLKSCLKPPTSEHKSVIRILNDQEIDEIVNAAIEAKLRQHQTTIEVVNPPNVVSSNPSCSTETLNLPEPYSLSASATTKSSINSFSSHTSVTSQNSSSCSEAALTTPKPAEFTRLEQMEIAKIAASREGNLKFLDTVVHPSASAETNVRPVVDVTISKPGEASKVARKKSKAEKCIITPEMWTYFARITSEQKKMWQLVQSIQDNLGTIPEIEDEIDARLRKQRTEEFSVRFARHFLYEVAKLTEDVRVAHKYNEDLCRRIYLLFQALQRAFAAYNKQLHHFVANGAPEKLEILMTLTLNAIRICVEKGIFDPSDSLIDMLSGKCESLKSWTVAQQRRQRPAIRELPITMPRKPKDRLSMYRSVSPKARVSRKPSLTKSRRRKEVVESSSQEVLNVAPVRRKSSRRLPISRVPSNIVTAVQQYGEPELAAEGSYVTELLRVLDAINRNSAEGETFTLQKLQTLLNAVSRPSTTPSVDVEVTKLEPERPHCEERPAKNILYTYVESTVEPTPEELQNELIQQEKSEFHEKCSTNPYYRNENFEKPWETISKISDQIVDDTLKLVVEKFDFGERQIVADFLRFELN